MEQSVYFFMHDEAFCHVCMQALLPSLDYTARIYAMWRICRGKAWFIFICVLNFFHVRLPSGAEYLLIARDEADLLAWVDAINKAIQNQTTMNPLSQSGHFSAAPSPLNPLTSVTGPGASSGMDTPPDPLPPPPSSLPPPLDDEKLLSPPSAIPSDVADMQAGNGSTEHPSPAISSHQPHEAAGDDKRRKKGRFKMFGASRKT
jgi:hypothetical protein